MRVDAFGIVELNQENLAPKGVSRSQNMRIKRSHQDVSCVGSQHEEHADVAGSDRVDVGCEQDDKARESEDQRGNNPDVALARSIGEPSPEKDQACTKEPRRCCQEESSS